MRSYNTLRNLTFIKSIKKFKMRYILLTLISSLFIYGCNSSNARSDSAKTIKKNNFPTVDTATSNKYAWLPNYDINNSIINRIPVPEGFKRETLTAGSFGDWLRHLPLKPGNPDVHLYNGKLKNYQEGHFAVLDIDVGSTDLQQCADAVMRMRAEYLYSIKDYDNLHFNFTSGHTIGFKKWTEGYRTKIHGNTVSYTKTVANDDSYKTFKNYFKMIFNYAGTSSLSKELKSVSDLKEIEIGDVFIVGGFPGHAVLVVDVCKNEKTGETLFLIQQSYMPAQEIHILTNFNAAEFSPWYSINFSDDLKTPEWTFSKNQLMRFEK